VETLAASGTDLFLPKSYDIVWSLVILVILALFFYKYFLPKFQHIFDERAEKIQGGIDKADQAQKEALEAKKKYEDKLGNARVEASKIRDDARAEASHIVADARSKAETEAAQVTANAQKSIESQQQQALVSLKGEVGVLATALAGKILGSKLDDGAVQSDMIDSMISDIDSDTSAK
jgi:F-type H+-transporting ATPase subunit b